jgi:glycosyltransferase involved in cell wall biosynthesis
MERWLATKTTRIIALSNMQQQQIVEQYRICTAKKIAVVPLGIELAAFKEQRPEKRRSFRDKYKLNPSDMAIGIVGRIVPIKNHELFVQTVALLQQRWPLVRFFIVGDGHLRKKLQHTCQILGINHTFYPEEPRPATIVFTSWITEVDKVMAGLDMVVLTSHNEGTPVSLMEAQASGIPVVSTKAGGIDDIVLHGQTGFTVARHQPEHLAAAIEKLLQNQTLMHTMGAAGEARANQQFRKERQVLDLNKLYQALLANH